MVTNSYYGEVNSMIRMVDVYKEYDNGTKAIKGLNLRIDDGEFAFLVGPSGSGKSTIIKLLTAEEFATKGRVMVNGYNLSTIKRRQIPKMRRTLGVIFQDFRLIDKKTVWGNLEFTMRIIGATNREMRKRIPYVLDLVGLSDKAKAYPNEMSGGEQQRVAIARALVNNPQMIIADEPTGNLDPQRSLEIMTLLERINSMGTTCWWSPTSEALSIISPSVWWPSKTENSSAMKREATTNYEKTANQPWIFYQRGISQHLLPRADVLCRCVHDCGLPHYHGLL